MSFLLSNELASCSCPHAYCALCWVFACSMYSAHLSRLKPSTAHPEPSDIHFPGNPCKGKLCLDMLRTRFASIFANLTLSYIIQHSSHEAFGQSRRDSESLWCADCILANPIPPKNQYSKNGTKTDGPHSTQLSGVDYSGEEIMYVLNPCVTENISFPKGGMASDGTSRSMALGAEQGEKDWSFIAMCDMWQLWRFDA